MNNHHGFVADGEKGNTETAGIMKDADEAINKAIIRERGISPVGWASTYYRGEAEIRQAYPRHKATCTIDQLIHLAALVGEDVVLDLDTKSRICLANILALRALCSAPGASIPTVYESVKIVDAQSE